MRSLTKRIALAGLVAALSFGVVLQDPQAGVPNSNDALPSIVPDPMIVSTQGQIVGVITQEGRDPVVATVDNDETGIIVRLDGSPLLKMPSSSRAALASALAQQHARLDALSDAITRADNEVRAARGLAARERSDVVRHRYTHVFNGLAARVRRETLDRVRKLPGVTGVWIDQRVTATLAESVSVIRADKVWQQLGNTGAGVKVAIIDTGVDYTHPDLGGCLGAGCKVFFGWDFANNDADPMDDQGHGTHVAGIVAASGTVTGVAPDALLMAIKVLNSGGSGNNSDIIAGIELATNPDGDPGTPDGAQVMNVSLGGPGDPDDPMSQAVDTAVAAGVVMAVAAGNSGPGYETLGSPGCARQALTVGATDKYDNIAGFSSRGSALKTWEIKPEVVAPGVGIVSTVPAGSCQLCDPSGYKALNGTSMATPHVAGAAALILAAHPTWTPAQVKAALMQSAVDLGNNVFTQGNGRIDAYAAVTPGVLVDHADFSVGRDSPGLPSFSASQTFTLANLTSTARDYALSVAGTFPSGFTATLDRPSVHLDPSQSAGFTLTLTIDNSRVPNLDVPFAYEGKVVVTGVADQMQFPFAVLKAPLLTLYYDEAPFTTLVHDRGMFFRSWGNPPATLSTLVPTTPVDVVTNYNDYTTWVVRERLALAFDTAYEVNKAEAVNTFTVALRDENNTPVPLTRSTTAFGPFLKSSGSGTMTLVDLTGRTELIGDDGSSLPLHLSALSDAYAFEASVLQDPAGPGPMYLFHAGARDGVYGPMLFQNNPGDFKHLTWRYTPEPGGTTVTPRTFMTTKPFDYNIILAQSFCDQPLTAPFERQAYLMTPPYPEYRLGYIRQEVFAQAACVSSDRLYSTPYLTAADPTRLDGYVAFRSPAVYSSTSPVFASGAGPFSWSGQFYNSPSQMAVDGFPFLSQSKDARDYPPLPYELWQAGVIAQTGQFKGFIGQPLTLTVPVTPGAYRLRVPYTGFHVGGQAARADASAVFDTSLADPNPPTLASVGITSGGVRTAVVPAGGATLILRTLDETGLAEISAMYKEGGNLRPVPLTPQPGGWYTGPIPGTGSPRVVPLTVVLEDTSGNSLTWSYCTAGTATPEVCNGFDDDCDAIVPAAEVDADGDRVPQCTPDCDDDDRSIWGTPGEVAGVRLSRVGTQATLEWSVPPGGEPTGMVYDVLRSTNAADFVQGAVCLETADGPNVTATDNTIPAVGQVFHYLVRAHNGCASGDGTLGTSSAGIVRPGRTCS